MIKHKVSALNENYWKTNEKRRRNNKIKAVLKYSRRDIHFQMTMRLGDFFNE